MTKRAKAVQSDPHSLTRAAGPDAVSVSPSHALSPAALSRINLTLADLKAYGIDLTSELLRLLRENKTLLDSRAGGYSEALSVFLRGDRLDRYSPAQIDRFLKTLTRTFSLEPRFHDGREQLKGADLDKFRRIAASLVEFLRSSGESLSNWSKRTYDSPPHKKLTKCLRAQGVIGGEDVVTITGRREGHVQIRIGKPGGGPSSDSHWFLWNSDSGGYVKTFAEGAVFFVCILDSSDFNGLHSGIARFQSQAASVISAALAQNTEFRAKVHSSIELVPVTAKLADNLRLLAVAKKGYSGEGGGYHAGDILGYSAGASDKSAFSERHRVSAGQILGTHWVTTSDYVGRGRGFNGDLALEFASSRNGVEIAEFQRAINLIRKDADPLASEFRKFFTGYVGDYRRLGNAESAWNIFHWFFYNWDCSKTGCYGYTSFVRYDPQLMQSGIEWLAGVAGKLAEKSPYFEPIVRGIAAFKKCPGYSEIFGGGRKSDGRMSDGESYFDEDNRDWGGSISGGFGGYKKQSDFGGERYLRSDGNGPELERIAKISGEYPDEVWGLWRAFRRFENLLIWARYANTCKVQHVTPLIGPEQTDLAIEDGRNISLVLDPNIKVVANSVRFDDSQRAILLVGANGQGKTHLLEMIGNVAVYGHKGVDVIAKSATVPLLAEFDFNVNSSAHSEDASSFQNDIRSLIAIVHRADGHLPETKGLVIYDELGRGTDARDAIPLIIGTLKFLDARGIYFAGSTHFNLIGSLGEIFERYGLRVGIYTMQKGAFKLVPGTGKSGGIDLAEAASFSPEIIAAARAVVAASDSGPIELPAPAVQPQATTTDRMAFTARELSELGICKPATREYGLSSHKHLGSATRVFAEHTPFKSGEYSDKSHKYLPQLAPAAAEVFVELLCRPLSGAERNARIAAFDALIANQHYRAAHATAEKLAEFETVFSIYEDKKTRSNQGLFDVLHIGMAQELQDDRIKTDRMKAALMKLPLPQVLEAMTALSEQVRRLGVAPCAAAAETIDRFLASEGPAAMRKFAAAHPVFLGEDKELSIDDWRDWVNLCLPYQLQLLEAWKAVMTINFYSTVAETIDVEKWKRVDNSAPPGVVEIKGADNTRLRYLVEKVTLIDVTLSPDCPTAIIRGTNGGGKSQALQVFGSILFFDSQIGFAPVMSARIGQQSFLSVMITSSAHTQDRSSFQAEVARLKQLIDEYEASGSPSGGVFVLDEPDKGTSEEEAVPLLAGLDQYCRARGVRLLFTTHFSGITDVLDRIREARYRSLYVDYFSPDKRYQLLEGVGESSGIRVAELEGIPAEIISVAREVAEILKRARAERTKVPSGS